jgi:ABC-type nitrate/sulfonate/bicarbonate transport system permease component
VSDLVITNSPSLLGRSDPLRRYASARIRRLAAAALPTTQSRAGRLLVPVATLALLVTAQEAATRHGLIDGDRFPLPSAVLATLSSLIADRSIWVPLASTLSSWSIAVLIAFAGALVLGTLIGLNRYLLALTAPVIEFLRPVPATALIPLAILTLGANATGAIALTVFGAIWQILPLVVRGVRTVDPVSRDTARVFGLSPWQQTKWLVVPAMEPYLLTGLRIGATTALLLLISVELLAGVVGVGREIAIAYAGANLPLMYAYILVAGTLGCVLNLLTSRLIDLRAAALRGGRR